MLSSRVPGDDLYSVGAAVTMSGRIPRVSGWTQPDGPGHHDRDSTHEILRWVRGRCGVGMVRIGCIADYMGARETLTAEFSERWSNCKRLEILRA